MAMIPDSCCIMYSNKMGSGGRPEDEEKITKSNNDGDRPQAAIDDYGCDGGGKRPASSLAEEAGGFKRRKQRSK